MIKFIFAIISSTLLLQAAGQQPPGGKGAPATPPPANPAAGKETPKPAPAPTGPFYEDTLVTRDRKEFRGRLHDYRDYVVVEQADTKRFTVRRTDIERIEYAPRFIRFPEVVPFPTEFLTEKTGYEFVGSGDTILCLPKTKEGKILVAIDIRTGKKLWDKPFEGRACDPVVAGRTVYLVGKTTFKDDTQKVKIKDAEFSKDVHKLRFLSIDLDSGSTVWDETIENNGKTEFWEFADKPPVVYATPQRVYLMIKLRFFPFERGNIVKEKEKTYVSLYTFDTTKKEKALLGRRINSEDLIPALEGTPYEDSMLYETQVQNARNTIVAVSLDSGKKMWEAEPFLGRFVKVVGDTAYVRDATHLYAHALKAKGVKDKRWSVAHENEEVSGFDANYVYVNRVTVQPREFMGFSLKTGKKEISLRVPDGDNYTYQMHIGHRLLYTDVQNTLWCYDTLKLGAMWKWGRAEGGALASRPYMMGSALAMLKDGRINMLDVNTGRVIWQVRGTHTLMQPVGEFGMITTLMTGRLELLRERKPPEGTRFFTSTGTPLSASHGEEAWSRPALAPDRMYSLTASGILYSIDLKGGDHWTLKMPAAVRRPFAVTLTPGGLIVVHEGTLAHFIDPKERKQVFELRGAQFSREDRTLFPLDKNLIMIVDGHVGSIDPAKNGEAAWKSAVFGVRDFLVADQSVYVLSEREGVHILNARTGEPQGRLVAPSTSSAIALDGKRVLIQLGPFSIGEPSIEDTSFSVRHAAAEQNPGIQTLTPGSAVAAGGNAVFSNADKKVVALDLKTWKVAWTFDAPEYTSELAVQGDRVYFAAAGRGLFGLNAKTGAVEWKAELFDSKLFAPTQLEGKLAFWSSEGWAVVPK